MLDFSSSQRDDFVSFVKGVCNYVVSGRQVADVNLLHLRETICRPVKMEATFSSPRETTFFSRHASVLHFSSQRDDVVSLVK